MYSKKLGRKKHFLFMIRKNIYCTDTRVVNMTCRIDQAIMRTIFVAENKARSKKWIGDNSEDFIGATLYLSPKDSTIGKTLEICSVIVYRKRLSVEEFELRYRLIFSSELPMLWSNIIPEINNTFAPYKEKVIITDKSITVLD